jgi:hypothetical protein
VYRKLLICIRREYYLANFKTAALNHSATSPFFNSNVFFELAANLPHWQFQLLHFGAESVGKAGAKPTKSNVIEMVAILHVPERIPLVFDRSRTRVVSRFEVQLDQVLPLRMLPADDEIKLIAEDP